MSIGEARVGMIACPAESSDRVIGERVEKRVFSTVVHHIERSVGRERLSLRALNQFMNVGEGACGRHGRRERTLIA